jgi:hypothetical protein
MKIFIFILIISFINCYTPPPSKKRCEFLKQQMVLNFITLNGPNISDYDKKLIQETTILFSLAIQEACSKENTRGY